jgi:SAM-dependent MidA family methyltransferase
VNALQTLIVAEIDRGGPIPFSAYMELALYHPVLGFYADGGAGRRRDFITSPEVGPLFGAVVAQAVDAWWDELGRPDSFTFVDAGAGPGSLARTVGRCELRCRDALNYVAVEVSAVQRERHPDGVVSTDAMPKSFGAGVIFANELLDNLPFDIEAWDGRTQQWSEVRVGFDGDHLVEVSVPTDEPFFGDLQSVGQYPDHPVRTPVHRHARTWWRDAVASVDRGWVVAIDYGRPLLSWPDQDDWLRTYSDHGLAGSALVEPGTKDITTDVYWQQIAAMPGRRAQSSHSFDTQADWLQRYGIGELVEAGRDYWQSHAAAPDLKAIEMRSRVGEAEALLDPTGLGAFDVFTHRVLDGRPPDRS